MNIEGIYIVGLEFERHFYKSRWGCKELLCLPRFMRAAFDLVRTSAIASLNSDMGKYILTVTRPDLVCHFTRIVQEALKAVFNENYKVTNIFVFVYCSKDR